MQTMSFTVHVSRHVTEGFADSLVGGNVLSKGALFERHSHKAAKFPAGTILNVAKVERQCGLVRSAVLYKFVLYEGNVGFLAVASSTLAERFDETPPQPGFTLRLLDYSVIPTRSSTRMASATVLIHDFEMVKGPGPVVSCPVPSEVCHFDPSWIGFIRRTAQPLPCRPKYNPTFGKYLLTFCLCHSPTILADPSICQCVTRWGYSACVTCAVPVHQLDTNAIFVEVQELSEGLMNACSYEECDVFQRRQCLVWFYGLHLFGGASQEDIPFCVVSYIDRVIPDTPLLACPSVEDVSSAPKRGFDDGPGSERSQEVSGHVKRTLFAS